MNISTFKIFRDLVEARSFSKSAALNAVTQSAVSQQVANLEKRLKCLLVERGKREFALTVEGQRFYEGCHALTETYKNLLTELQEMNQRVNSSVHISTIDSIGFYDLPPFLKSYFKQYPFVKVQVEHRHSNQVYEDVLTGIADFGLVAFPEKKSSLEIKPFREDRLIFVCHSKHRLANFKKVSIRQMTGCKFIGLNSDAPTRRVLEALFKKHQINPPIVEFENIEALKHSVEGNTGIALVPWSSITQEIKKRSLKVVKLTDEEISRPLGIVYRCGQAFSPALKAFLQILESGPKAA